MQAIVDPVYYKRTQRISPGVVGSVGDAINGVRLRQSAPDMAMRYTFENPKLLGSNVQDGNSKSMTSKGGPATVVQKHYPMAEGFKHAHGWKYQDLRAPDTLHEPLLAPLEQYSWRNKVATIYEAKRTGDMFLPLPGPYQPTSMTRGSQIPRVVETEMGLQVKEPVSDVKDSVVMPQGQKYKVCLNRAGQIVKVEQES